MSKTGLSILVAAGVLPALLAIAVTKRHSEATTIPARSTPPGDAASPVWELNDLDGKTVKSADFNGKVMILDFWATWCPPCRMEIPGFIELQKKYEKQGLVVVGISLDEGGAAAVKSFREKEGINYPIVLGTETVVRAFKGVESIPTTFIIDRQGRLVGKHEGFTEKGEFEQQIKALLKQ